MTDCPNAGMRDLLPDFVHDSLDGERRAEVEAHLGACATCSAEVMLLRSVRGALSQPMSLNTARIASAIPAASKAPRGVSVPMVWRRAAVIMVAALGGLSLLMLRDGLPGTARDDRQRTAQAESVAVPSSEPGARAPVVSPAVVRRPAPATSATRVASGPGAASGLTLGGGMADLSSAEMELLLGELDTFDGVIAEEPIEVLPGIELGDGR